VLDKPASTIWPKEKQPPSPSNGLDDIEEGKELEDSAPDPSRNVHGLPSDDASSSGSVVGDKSGNDEPKPTPYHLQDDDLPGQIAKISISHDGGYATAVCLAAEEPHAGDVGGEAAAREP